VIFSCVFILERISWSLETGAEAFRVNCAVSARDFNILSEIIFRIPLMGVSVNEELGSAVVVLMSSKVTLPPMPVPCVGIVFAPIAFAAAVKAGLFSSAARISRSMILPSGPVPVTASTGRASFSARLRARGEMNFSEFISHGGTEARRGEGDDPSFIFSPLSSYCVLCASAPLRDVFSGLVLLSAFCQSSPGLPITAIGAKTGTSSPVFHKSLRTVPASPTGTSKDALSVSTSHTGVSAVTSSPSFIFQFTMMHDSTVFP
jgi:hypothetical protein